MTAKNKPNYRFADAENAGEASENARRAVSAGSSHGIAGAPGAEFAGQPCAAVVPTHDAHAVAEAVMTSESARSRRPGWGLAVFQIGPARPCESLCACRKRIGQAACGNARQSTTKAREAFDAAANL